MVDHQPDIDTYAHPLEEPVQEGDSYRFAMVPEWLIFSGVTGEAVRLYCVLARMAGKRGYGWEYRKTLAERMECSERSVNRYLAELVEVGAVTVSARRDRSSGAQLANIYTVHFTRQTP